MTLGQGNLLYNRYRVVEILGRGGMGAVYRATDESLGVDVAVKENLFTTDDYARQFRMEAVILAGIRHSNLPRVTDHFVIDDMGQYLVMDYIEGDDLRQRMEKKGPISEEEAIHIGSAACDALAYLHSRKPPILHRDIKLGNIKITSSGQVYLVDFGLAKMGWEHEETMTGARAMTPGYSPPEQYGSARTDARSDVYSLGATLYAALTGVIPEDSLMRAVDGVLLTPLRNHRPEISQRLASVIEKALETSAANRYQSAEAFKQALLGIENTENAPAGANAATPVTSQPAPITRQASKKPAFPIWRLVTFVLILLVVALGVILFNPGNQNLFQRGSAAQPGQTASLAAAPTQAAAALPAATPTQTNIPKPAATLTSTLTPTTAPSAAPTTNASPTSQPAATDALVTAAQPTQVGGGTGEIAYASMVNNVAQIFIVNADGSNLRQLTNEPEGACSFDWSPDGKQIVYTTPCAERRKDYPNSALFVLNLESNKSTALPLTPGGDFEPVWSPNGEEIAFTSMRDGSMQIYVFKFSDASLTRLTDPGYNIQAHYPAWSPDSSQIVYTSMRSGLLQIWTMAADGSKQKQQVRTGGTFSDYLPAWSPDGASLLFSETNVDLTAPASLHRYRFESNQSDLLPVSLPAADAHFSPDGNWIVYEGAESSNQDIYIWNMHEGKPQRLTTSNKVDFDAVWRPGQAAP